MLDSMTILIVDGNSYGALDLCEAIECSGGSVAGPVASLPEAAAILDRESIGAAVVDCDLPDGEAVILLLAGRDVPLVVQTSVPLPPPIAALDGRLSIVMRPIDPRAILESLLTEIGKAECRDRIMLGPAPKQV